MAVPAIPPGFHTVTPHLVLRNCTAALEFYKKAFGAAVTVCMPGMEGKGVGHAEIKIGDSMIFMADEWPGMETAAPEKFGGTTVSIHLYVKDCDALFKQAVDAGAKVTMPLTNMFWGDRFGKLVDPFGHSWAIATHIEDVPPEELGKRAADAMKHMAAGKK